MGVTGVADGLNPLQEGWSVKVIRNYVGSHGLGERWPAGAGLEFLRGVEQNRVAAEAGIDSRFKQAAHLRAEGALGAGLTCDMVLLRAELLPPFGVRLNDFVVRGEV